MVPLARWVASRSLSGTQCRQLGYVLWRRFSDRAAIQSKDQMLDGRATTEPFEDDGGIITMSLGTGSDVEELWKRILEPGTSTPVDIIKDWMQEGGRPSRKDLTSILSRLRTRGRFKQGYWVSKWMLEERPCRLTELDLVNHLYFTAHSLRFDEATQLLKEFPQAHRNEVTYTVLLSGSTANDDVRRAERLWNKMKRLRLVTTVHGYNNMLLMYERKHMYSMVRKLYADMVISDIQPDALTYSVLLRCKVDGVEEKASAAMKLLESKERVPCSQMLDMLRVYGYLADLDGIERLQVRLHKERGSVSWTIEAFGLAGAVNRAEETLRRTSQPTAREYSALLGVYRQAGMLDKSEQLLDEMVGSGHEPGDAAYSSVILGWLGSDKPDKAMELLDKVVGRRPASGSLYPSILALVEECGHRGNVRAAEQLVERFKDASFADVKLHNALLHVHMNS